MTRTRTILFILFLSIDLAYGEVKQFFTDTYAKPTCSYEALLVEHARMSLEKAVLGQSLLQETLFDFPLIPIHHLLNNLCTLTSASYLQAGLGQGETLISALYGNTGQLTEKVGLFFLELEPPNPYLIQRCNQYFQNGVFQILRNVPESTAIKATFDIYFYDPIHSLSFFKKSIANLDSILATLFILVIDDWAWENVRRDAFEAFEELDYIFLSEQELPATQYFGNGQYVAVIKKQPPKVKR